MAVAFRELGVVRRGRSIAKMEYGLRRVLKNKKLSKTLYNLAMTEDEAETNRQNAMALNPGSIYVVVKRE